MQTTIDNINYKLFISKFPELKVIQKTEKLLQNDVYEKYKIKTEIEGELVVCNDINKIHRREKKMVKDKYEDYIDDLLHRDNFAKTKDNWIYNILDGISEQESILYKDDNCIIVPNYLWDGNDATKMHILCMPIDKSLRTIRSLDFAHIPLLQHMKKMTLNIIKDKYNLDESNLKIFFHYEPSTYHLHIHFVHILNTDSPSSVEYSHDLDSVIFNLSICSNYYKLTELNKRVNII